MNSPISPEAFRAALSRTITPEKIRAGLRALAEQSGDPQTAARARKLAADYGINITPDHHARHTDPDAK